MLRNILVHCLMVFRVRDFLRPMQHHATSLSFSIICYRHIRLGDTSATAHMLCCQWRIYQITIGSCPPLGLRRLDCTPFNPL